MTHDPETMTLLRRWHDGDVAALDDLLQRDLPWLRAQVRQRIGDEVLARVEVEDVVQNAMVHVLRHGPRFVVADREHYRALLLRIVENTIRKQVRDGRRHKRDVAREQSLPSGSVLALDAQITRPSAAADRNERRAWVQLALELLGPADREVIMLRQWEGLSFAGLGERCGISEDAARMRFDRAVARLARIVKRLRGGELPRVLAESI